MIQVLWNTEQTPPPHTHTHTHTHKTYKKADIYSHSLTVPPDPQSHVIALMI